MSKGHSNLLTSKLNLNNPTVIKTSFDKPQLSITFNRKYGMNDGDIIENEIRIKQSYE